MKREQILETAFREYAKYGVKRVSVDDIAQKLKISKKTIYEFFSGKDEFTKEAFIYKQREQLAKAEEIACGYGTPLEKILRLDMQSFRFFSNICEHFFNDIANTPALREVGESWFNKMKSLIMGLISEGIKEGELREDENYEILGPLTKSQIINNLSIEELTNKYRPDEICKITLITIMKSYSTPKGREVLKRIEKEDI